MKQFSLAEALAGKPFQTRSGKKVTDWHYFKTAKPYPIFVIFGDGKLHAYTTTGSYGHPSDEYDLIMTSEKKKVPLIDTDLPPEFWVNLGAGYAYWCKPLFINDYGIKIYTGGNFSTYSFGDLFDRGAFYSTNRVDKKPFHKEVEV